MNVIELKNAGEKYHVKFIKEGQISWEEIWALRGADLAIAKGETLGVIGQNGSGKTTLLKLIAGMLIPDTGSVNISGKISTIMELGAGFNPEFTGRENIIVNAKIYGLEDRTLKLVMKRIIGFADLGKFIDAPIKYYSQGMYMRLAFALAIFIDPDILLIDDILAVGDEEAQQKCVQKIFELKSHGKTIIIISHDMVMINKLCDRVILLERGQIVRQGPAAKVVSYYLETIGDKKGVAILESRGMRVVFNNGRLTMSYKGIPVTKGMDSCVYFYQDKFDLWSPSFNLFWEVKESQDNAITAEGVDSEGKSVLRWLLRLEDSLLKWEVETEQAVAKNTHINLFLVSRYTEWSDLDKSRAFPAFIHKTNWQEINLLPYLETFVGINADRSDIYPALLIGTDTVENQIKIFNSGYEQESRVIQVSSSKNLISLRINLYEKYSDFDKYLEEARQTLMVHEQKENVKDVMLQSIVCGPLRLFADMKNKALRIYYKDKEITRGNGLHTSFLFDKIWHSTSDCEWQVAREDDTLYLKFSWVDPKFFQICKFRFQGNTLLLSNNSEIYQDFKPETIKFGLCVCTDYESFFCGHQLGGFPEEFSYWQTMQLQNPNADYFGLRMPPKLPAVVYDNKDRFSCLIQNGDFQNHFRVLQVILPSEMLLKKVVAFSTQLIFLEDESFIFRYVKEEKEKLVLKRQKERQIQREQATISYGNVRLFADVENKVLHLYHKDKEITNGSGLYSSFRLSGGHLWTSFKDAQLSVQKTSGHELIIKFDYPYIVQIWKCICKDSETIEFIIELEVKRTLSLANHEVRIELQDIYERWSTVHEEGDFSVVQYVNNIGPVRLKNSRVNEVVLQADQQQGLRGLSFETSFPPRKQILGIYKSKYPQENNTCLNFSLIIPKKEECLDPGKYVYFMGRIIFDKLHKIKDRIVESKATELKNRGLIFLFEQGTGRLLFGKKELTAGLGIYTSVRSSGIWYDSYQASWDISQANKQKIIAVGNWPYIPISQHFNIELVDSSSIFIKVDMDVYEDTYFEIEQTNLMLINKYTHWEVPGMSKGEFSDEYTQDYDILPFRFWYSKLHRDGIVVTGRGLPAIAFKYTLQNELLRIVVENTDYIHKSRLIQYQKCNMEKLRMGRYPYFSGVVKIGPE